MQRLEYEAAWEKTISKQDREHISNIFTQTKENVADRVETPLIRVAKNHLDHLLVTVLVHNGLSTALTFTRRKVTLEASQQNITKEFTIDALQIPAYTSMPWTFIFTERFGQINSDDVLALTII